MQGRCSSAAVQQYLQQVAAAAGLQDQHQLEPQEVEQLVEHFTMLSIVQQQLTPLPVQNSSSMAAAKAPAGARAGRKSLAAGTTTKRASTAASQPAAAATGVRRSARPSPAAAAACQTDDARSVSESDDSGHSNGTESTEESEDSSNDADYQGITVDEFIEIVSKGRGMQPAVAGKNPAISSSSSSSSRPFARQPLAGPHQCAEQPAGVSDSVMLPGCFAVVPD